MFFQYFAISNIPLTEDEIKSLLLICQYTGRNFENASTSLPNSCCGIKTPQRKLMLRQMTFVAMLTAFGDGEKLLKIKEIETPSGKSRKLFPTQSIPCFVRILSP